MKPGAVLKDVYESTQNFIVSKRSSWVDKLISNFGFSVTIGL